VRRHDLITAVRRISSDFEESGLIELLKGKPDKEGHGGQSSVFQVFHKWSIASSNYGDTERKVLEIFNLGLLLQPATWGEISSTIEQGSIRGFADRVINVAMFAKQIVDLLAQDYVEDINSGLDTLPPELRGKTILTAIVVEERGHFSNPERILFAIRSISDLYEIHATIASQEANDLVLLSCDSGSDKSFDFAGAGKVISAVKDTLIGLWDRIVFYRHAQAGATVDLIARSLPVFGSIAELEQNKKISSELAEQLRRKTLGACAKFVEAGVIIPEMDEEASQAPRLLMKPAPKLLAGPAQIQASELEGVSTSSSDTQDTVDQGGGEEVDLVAEIRDLKRRLQEAEDLSMRTGRKTTKSSPRKT
jgi:hypothetical protein